MPSPKNTIPMYKIIIGRYKISEDQLTAEQRDQRQFQTLDLYIVEMAQSK